MTAEISLLNANSWATPKETLEYPDVLPWALGSDTGRGDKVSTRRLQTREEACRLSGKSTQRTSPRTAGNLVS